MTKIGLRTATRQDLEAIVGLLAKDPLGQTREYPESARQRYEEAHVLKLPAEADV